MLYYRQERRKEVVLIAITDAQKKASEKWRRKATKNYSFQLHLKKDADLVQYMETVKSKAGTVKKALRAQMKNEQKN